jgi:hypothetical protein
LTQTLEIAGYLLITPISIESIGYAVISSSPIKERIHPKTVVKGGYRYVSL